MSQHDLAAALLAVQKSAPVLRKDSKNPHFKNTYIGLDSLMETILPLLNDNGLVLLQFPTIHGGAPALRTRILHAKTGTEIEDTMLLVLDRDNPQGQGSAITYARRYALMSILGLVADEDDDGAAASPRKQEQSSSPGANEVSASLDSGSSPI